MSACRCHTPATDVAGALALLAAVWTLLALGPRAEWLAPHATPLAFAAATGLVVATRRRGRCARTGRAAALLAVGLLAGLASFPGWIAALLPLGSWLGLATAPTPRTPPDVGSWACALALGPALEELLYRERLLAALARALGPVAAVLVTSALFAASHIEPWHVLTTFCLGIALGLAMWTTGSLALCIGIHAGLNLAALSRALAALASAALLAAPGAATAAERLWVGTLALEFTAPGLGPIAASGAGVASVNGSLAGAHLVSLELAGGVTGSETVPVTDPAAPSSFLAVQASVALGTGELAPFAPSAAAGAPQLTRATLPVAGVLRLCVLSTDCDSALAIPLTRDLGASGLGVGGLVTLGGFGKGTQISALAAPWTVRTATISLATPGGSGVTATARGWRHGAVSFTSSTAIPGGALSLVAPLHIETDAGDELGVFARLGVRFVPEPARGLSLASGLVALALLARQRRRS